MTAADGTAPKTPPVRLWSGEGRAWMIAHVAISVEGRGYPVIFAGFLHWTKITKYNVAGSLSWHLMRRIPCSSRLFKTSWRWSAVPNPAWKLRVYPSPPELKVFYNISVASLKGGPPRVTPSRGDTRMKLFFVPGRWRGWRDDSPKQVITFHRTMTKKVVHFKEI